MSSFQRCNDSSDRYAAMLAGSSTDPSMAPGATLMGFSKAASLRTEQQLLQARGEERRRALLLALISSSNPRDDAFALQEVRASFLRQNTMMGSAPLLNQGEILNRASEVLNSPSTFGVSPPIARRPVQVNVPAWNVLARERPLEGTFSQARMLGRLESTVGGTKQRGGDAMCLPSNTSSKISEKSKEASVVKDEPEDEAAFFDASGSKERFPAKLYRMIYEMDKEGRSDVISFLPHGKAFAIHKEEEFVSDILPRYFTNCQLPSFQKQLNLYGFCKLTVGKDAGKLRYFHASFLKGKPSLTEKIQRRRTGAAKRK